MLMAGVDVGFGFTKATDGESSTLFKSIVGEPQPRSMEDNFFSGETVPGLHVTMDGRSYFVGDLAESESRVRQFTGSRCPCSGTKQRLRRAASRSSACG